MARKDPEQRRQYNRDYFLRNHGQLTRDMRVRNLDGRHHMSPLQYAEMWDAQGGCCYLCGDSLGSGFNVHIDHDHRCCPPGQSCAACWRGLSCRDCNGAIGMAKDDPARLRRMADNLERAQRAVDERLASKPEQLTLEAS